MTRKPFQSKLLPHLDFIRECRAQHLSYPHIAADLRARFGLTAAPSTIFAFVKVRSRRRSVITLPASAPATVPPTIHPPREAVSRIGARSGWKFYDSTKPLVKDSS